MHPLIGRRVEGPTIGPKRIDERGGFVDGYVLDVSVDDAGSVLLLVTPDGESMSQCYATHCRLRGYDSVWQTSEAMRGDTPQVGPPAGMVPATRWEPFAAGETETGEAAWVLWRRMIRPVE